MHRIPDCVAGSMTPVAGHHSEAVAVPLWRLSAPAAPGLPADLFSYPESYASQPRSKMQLWALFFGGLGESTIDTVTDGGAITRCIGGAFLEGNGKTHTVDHLAPGPSCTVIIQSSSALRDL